MKERRTSQPSFCAPFEGESIKMGTAEGTRVAPSSAHLYAAEIIVSSSCLFAVAISPGPCHPCFPGAEACGTAWR